MASGAGGGCSVWNSVPASGAPPAAGGSRRPRPSGVGTLLVPACIRTRASMTAAPVPRLQGCARTSMPSCASSWPRATLSQHSCTTTVVRDGATTRVTRATVDCIRLRGRPKEQNCFGRGRSANRRVISSRRWPFPPASTIARRRHSSACIRSSSPDSRSGGSQGTGKASQQAVDGTHFIARPSLRCLCRSWPPAGPSRPFRRSDRPGSKGGAAVRAGPHPARRGGSAVTTAAGRSRRCSGSHTRRCRLCQLPQPARGQCASPAAPRLRRDGA